MVDFSSDLSFAVKVENILVSLATLRVRMALWQGKRQIMSNSFVLEN